MLYGLVILSLFNVEHTDSLLKETPPVMPRLVSMSCHLCLILSSVMLLLECVVYVSVCVCVCVLVYKCVCVCEPKPEEGVRSSMTTF